MIKIAGGNLYISTVKYQTVRKVWLFLDLPLWFDNNLSYTFYSTLNLSDSLNILISLCFMILKIAQNLLWFCNHSYRKNKNKNKQNYSKIVYQYLYRNYYCVSSWFDFYCSLVSYYLLYDNGKQIHSTTECWTEYIYIYIDFRKSPTI